MTDELRDAPDTSPAVLHTTTVYQGAIFDLIRDRVQLSTGAEPVVRDYLAHPGAVGILALRGEAGAEEVLVVRQYRHPVRARLWEIPAGLRDVDGEEPLLTAARELREEADLKADTWHVLTDIVNSPGSSSEGLRIYLARDLHECEAFERTHEEADMETRWVALSELAQAALAGDLHNTTLVVGVLAAMAARGAGFAALRPADAPWRLDGRHGSSRG